MRLGEIKQILDRSLSEDSFISIHHEPQYGGQAEKVNNYVEIIAALEVLQDKPWSGIDHNKLADLKAKHTGYGPALITQEDFNTLNELVNSVNPELPLFYSILDDIVKPQDEKTINIKLPSGISSFDILSDKNQSIEKVLKLYNVDGQFNFQGFDYGSDWYVVTTAGLLSYNFIISGLSIAQKYFEAKKTYWESKTAELEYLAAEDKDVATDEELEGYKNRKLKKLINYEVNIALSELGIGTNNRNELQTKLVMATTALIKELDEGVEFHLSLNPPAYAQETLGRISIDYTQIRPLIEKNEEGTKQLNAPPIDTDKSSSLEGINE